MSYALYGKHDTDKRFAPLDYFGHRVFDKKKVETFLTRKGAQARLDSVEVKEGCTVEVRKFKQ